MDLQMSPVSRPLRVLVVNPLSAAAQLVITKILSGTVFGSRQLIDLTLLVYSNERPAALDYKLELKSCAFLCMNYIAVSSDLPIFSDADVFCFITNIKNPNSIDVNNIDNDQFDALYLVIKIANSLSKQFTVPEQRKENPKKKYVDVEKARELIIMADGVITMSILTYLCRDVPSYVFFCCTPLSSIAKNVLGDHLKVRCHVLNDVLVWGANDGVFYIDVEKPWIRDDIAGNETKCDWDKVGQNLLGSVKVDPTQFNDSWMKKDFLDKVELIASKNPYGSISRAANFANTLRTIWKTRSEDNRSKTFASMGVISDGSLETIKGRPYVLPLVFMGDTWTVDKRFEETSHLQQEIKRINKAVKDVHDKLIPFCKKFVQENIINQTFIPVDEDSESVYTLTAHSRFGKN